MLSSFRVSWRNVTRHKKRFFFTLIAIVLGVTVMTSMFIAKSTFSSLMDEQERLTAGNADFWIQGTERFFSMDELDAFAERMEIEEGLASLTKHGFVEMETDFPEQASVRLTGISHFDNGIHELPVMKGDIKKEGLVITENTAKLWNKDIGDSVSFQDMGSIEITAIVAEGAMLNSPKDMETAMLRDFRVMVPLKTLQEWTGMENQISEYRFKVDSDFNSPELLDAYQSELDETNLFVQPIVVDMQQYNDVDGMYYVFDLIAILAIFISGFIAFNMINTSIVERKNEIAIMKSLGYTKANVMSLVAKETAILSVIGTILGLAVGICLGFVVQDILISAIITQDINYEVELVTPIITSTIIGFVFPFAAAALPLYKAGNTPILDAMFGRNNTAKRTTRLMLVRYALGVISTAIGLVDNIWAFLFLFVGLVLLFPLWVKLLQFFISPILILIFRFSGKQAIRSMNQFKGRNANTAAMLAIGVSLALFMSAALESMPKGMEEDIRATFGGDIIVQKETAWTENEIAEVNAIEGVEKVKAYAEVPNITWNTPSDELREFSVISYSDIHHAEMFDVLEDSDKESELPAIYVGERALIEMGAEVGKPFTFNTPAGEKDFFIKGSVQTSHYSGYVGFAEEHVIRDFYNWHTDNQLIINVVEEEMAPVVLSSIWAASGGTISNVESMPVSIEQAKSGITGMSDLMNGLLILVIAISAIGISNTLFMNTLERIKELGTMRALGFTKSQVRLMIIAEGLLIGITGVIVGTLYGILVIYLNSVSNDAPAFLDFSVPWFSLLLAIIGGIIFTLLASWLPSNSASRIPIKEAINYE
ncbi:FtsX-like permease family protein [Ornithinibacillus scapharcae]|uniref:FtsX-like permease family protein n=1 Tax=Ornithinibacillus scapharcae TaxID=1147159 RepID=UPI000225B588|nr:FtsX-like permease family protein [Ornithinibacillus scapharcae]